MDVIKKSFDKIIVNNKNYLCKNIARTKYRSSAINRINIFCPDFYLKLHCLKKVLLFRTRNLYPAFGAFFLLLLAAEIDLSKCTAVIFHVFHHFHLPSKLIFILILTSNPSFSPLQYDLEN